MKRLLSATVAAVAIAILAMPAEAAKPVISRYGFSATEALDASVCGFPVNGVVSGKGQTLEFLGSDGALERARSTGPIKVTFTNTSTGTTVTYSISGPGSYDADGALVRGTGRWYVFTAAGTPAVAVGNLTFGEDGVPEDPAEVVDICAALA
jgi:opacity protein-like surface antigen